MKKKRRPTKMKVVKKYPRGSDIVIPPGEYILDSLMNLAAIIGSDDRKELDSEVVTSVNDETFFFFNGSGMVIKDYDKNYALPHGWVVLKNVSTIGFKPDKPRYITMDTEWVMNFYRGSVLRLFNSSGYNFSTYSHLGATKSAHRPAGTLELLIKQQKRESKMFDINNFSFDQLLRENRQAAKEAEDRLAKALEDLQALKQEVAKQPELPEDIQALFEEAKDFMKKLQRVLDNHGYEVY